ncbi:MAG: hypothetical protein IJT01_02790 [Selenomonadaceae bacterium]|nr:hypothetical protein [Selenomonadaceae bacterium]
MGKFKTGCLGLIGIFIVIGIIGAIGGGGSKDKPPNTSSPASQQVAQKNEPQQQKQKEYLPVSVSALMQELEGNAAAASKKYKGKDLKVTGSLEVIDADGNYISLHGDQYSIVGVRCDINKKDKAQEDYLLNVQKGQTVTAYGTVTDVGEIMGYSLKVDKFE